MNKLVIVLIALLLLGGVWFYLSDSNTIAYTQTIETEVSALEVELAEIEAQVLAGTLTPDAAARAQEQIYRRLEAVDAAVAKSPLERLTPEQRTSLYASLDRLKGMLITFDPTIAFLESQVAELPEAERPKYRGRGSGSLRFIAEAFDDVIDSVAADVAEVSGEYGEVPEEVLEESGYEVVADAATTTEEETIDDALNDPDTATSSDEVNDTVGEESGGEDEMDNSVDDNETSTEAEIGDEDQEETTATSS